MYFAVRFVVVALMVGLFGAGAAAADPDPAQFIQKMGNDALTILADKTMPAAQKDQKFKTMLEDSFDLQTIGRFVIGRNWASATPDQQKDYMDLFRQTVVKAYSDKFSLYAGEGFTVKGFRAEGPRDFVVSSEITHPNGAAPNQIDWRVRNRDGKLGVIDVVIEGIGMSVTQRQEYASIIQRSGGQIAPLLDEMRKSLVVK